MKPKRPTPEPFHAIMIEKFNDDNCWEWYAIQFEMTPLEAVIKWLVEEEEMTQEDAEKSIEEHNDSYCYSENVRAIIITI